MCLLWLRKKVLSVVTCNFASRRVLNVLALPNMFHRGRGLHYLSAGHTCDAVCTFSSLSLWLEQCSLQHKDILSCIAGTMKAGDAEYLRVATRAKVLLESFPVPQPGQPYWNLKIMCWTGRITMYWTGILCYRMYDKYNRLSRSICRAIWSSGGFADINMTRKAVEPLPSASHPCSLIWTRLRSFTIH